MDAMNLNEGSARQAIGQRDTGYHALASAVLRTGFEAVLRPATKDVRIEEWLFLFSERADRLAQSLDLDLPMLRAAAWERGIWQGTVSHRFRSHLFRNLPDLDGLYPARPTGGRAGEWEYPPWSPDSKARVRRAFVRADARAVARAKQPTAVVPAEDDALPN